MTFTSSLAFFDHLMNEGALDEAALLAFLARSTSDEGLHLDFKTGRMFDPMPASEKKRRPAESDEDRRKRCAFVLRQYVAAFANSEGGVLAIGVKDQSRDEKVRGESKALDAITPAHEASIGNDLKGWASRCVSELIGYLGVLPRFSTVDVAGGKVLLVAVPRAPSLVPVVKDGKQAYYFRIEDEAREVYPHLVSDLILGRRRVPTVSVVADQWRIRRRSHSSETFNADETWSRMTKDVLAIVGPVIATNDSLITAEKMSGGFIAENVTASSQHPRQSITPDLLARIDVLAHAGEHPRAIFHVPLGWPPTMADDKRCNTMTLRPFEQAQAHHKSEWAVEAAPPSDAVASAALYLVPHGCDPIWFEVRCRVFSQTWPTNDGVPVEVVIERLIGRRPRVGIVAESAA
jgi:hypothetical protein